MFTFDEHLDNLVRHITLVQDACLLMGRRLIAQGDTDLGRIIIARGFRHDQTKFSGIEWRFLHVGPDVPQEQLDLAILQHIQSNDHHAEFWGNIDKMPIECLGEMICDCYARSQEFGTGLRDWIDKVAVEKYKPSKQTYKKMIRFVNILLKDSFRKSPKK